MGSYSNTYSVPALSDSHINAMFTFNTDIKHLDLPETDKTVQEAIRTLDASKYSYAQAIRYLKKGTTKRQLESWPQKMAKHNKLIEELKSALVYAGEAILRLHFERKNNPIVHSSCGVQLSNSSSKASLFSERLAEIQKGKSKTKSCSACEHRYETKSLTVLDVMYCRACGVNEPFSSASFTKKRKSATAKAQRALDALEKSHNKLMKECPYMYEIIYVYPDDECHCDSSPDDDPFEHHTTPRVLDNFLMRMDAKGLSRWFSHSH